MPNQPFTYLIDDFSGGMNTYDSTDDLKSNEAQEITQCVIKGKKIVLAKELSTTNLPADSTMRWMRFWADSQDTWYILLALDDGTNTDLKCYSGATWNSNITKTDLFVSDKVSTPDSYTVGGELRIGGSITNYHKFIKYFPLTYRLGNTTGAAETHAYIAAGLKMYKGEIEYPNENSEILQFTITGQDSGYDFVNGDVVEYAMSYTYDNAQESLLYALASATETMEAGERNAIALLIAPSTVGLSWRVTHINIYRSLNKGDFYLLTRLQVTSPDATADYGETTTGIDWTWTDGTNRGNITIYDTGKNLTTSYTSRTGYSDYIADDGTTEYKDDSLKTFWKVSAVCQGRAVVGNVSRYVGTDLVTYNDRLYFSSVGKFDSFYKNHYIDLETGDGDQITALLSLGTRLIVFKENNMYIWNMGTRSELNWQLEASYRGYGVAGQKNAFITPYGIAFSNSNGIYLYNGSREPIDLSRNVRKSLTGNNIAIGYDPIERRILGFEGVGYLWIIDIDDNWITRRAGFGSMTIQSFDIYNSSPYIIDTAGDKMYKVDGNATLLADVTYVSGDMKLGTNKNKMIKRVRIKYLATSSGSPTITFYISNDYYTTNINVVLPESAKYRVHEFYPHLFGRQFRFRIYVSVAGLDTFELDSIEIDGKVYRT